MPDCQPIYNEWYNLSTDAANLWTEFQNLDNAADAAYQAAQTKYNEWWAKDQQAEAKWMEWYECENQSSLVVSDPSQHLHGVFILKQVISHWLFKHGMESRTYAIRVLFGDCTSGRMVNEKLGKIVEALAA